MLIFNKQKIAVFCLSFHVNVFIYCISNAYMNSNELKTDRIVNSKFLNNVFLNTHFPCLCLAEYFFNCQSWIIKIWMKECLTRNKYCDLMELPSICIRTLLQNPNLIRSIYLLLLGQIQAQLITWFTYKGHAINRLVELYV